MSDFDKEAERERLREKYERDQQKRQATQRMSDLLLKGATMTNRHCGVCGDPLFRYDGQEFCPAGHGNAEVPEGVEGEEDAGTTGGTADQGTAEPGASAARGSAGEASGPAGGDEGEPAPTDGTEAPAAGADAGHDGGSDPGASTAGRPAADPPTADRTTAEGSAADGAPAVEPSAAARERVETPSSGGPTGRADRRRPPSQTGAAGGDGAERVDLDAARESVARTLARMATAAEERSDPRQAREYLAAAREAAETLAALDR